MVSVASHAAAHSAAHATGHSTAHAETVHTTSQHLALIAATNHGSNSADAASAQVAATPYQPTPVEQISPVAQFAFLCLLAGTVVIGIVAICTQKK
jgi:hypothetical protein